MHRGRRLALAACTALAMAGCATAPRTPAPVSEVRLDTTFHVEGRLSARRGNEAVAVHFDWRHAPDHDSFDVATPLGQIVARMVRDASGVRVERPREPPTAYVSWSALTEAVLGVGIPVAGLVAWVQGAPSAVADADIERDVAGRASVLREQGWEIVYAYVDGAATRPVRLVMRYPGAEPIEVRIVVDRWSTPS